MKKWETLKKNVALLLTAAVLVASCTPMAYGTVTAAEETPPAADEVPDIQIHAAVDTATGQGSNGFSIDPAEAFGSSYAEVSTKWLSSGTNAAYQCADGTTPAIYTNISGASAKFTPTIPKSGYYEVYYWALQGMNTNGTVTSNGTADQAFETHPAAVPSGNGGWQKVGVYQFAQTNDTNKDSQFVQVKKGSASIGIFRVSSVKFVYAGGEEPTPTPTITPTASPSPVVIDGEAQSDGSIWYQTSENTIRTNIEKLTGNNYNDGIRFETTGAAGTQRAYIKKVDPSKVTADTYMEVSINVPKAGYYKLQFVGNYNSKYGNVYINDQLVTNNVSYVEANDNTVRTDTAGIFKFNAGDNTVRLYHNGKVNNILRLDVVSLTEVYEVKTENAAGTVTGAGKYEYGEKATVTADGNEDYTFAYWQEGDKIVSYDPSYTFTVTGDTELIAQFKPVAAENTCKVVFKDINGVVLGTIDNVTKDSKLTDDQINAVQVPSKPGRTFERWDKDLTQTTVTQDTIVTAVYTKTSDTYTVSIDGTVHNTLPFDTKVTVTADAQKDGQSFSYWQEIGGKIVSYNPSYSFYVAKNINLTAVYGQTVVYAPVVTTMNPIIDSANQKMSFISQIVLPSGCEMIECGTLIYNQAGEFDLETTGVKKVKARTQTEAGQYMATLTGIPSNSTRYARGYLVYQITGESSVTAVYGDIVNGTLE